MNHFESLGNTFSCYCREVSLHKEKKNENDSTYLQSKKVIREGPCPMLMFAIFSEERRDKTAEYRAESRTQNRKENIDDKLDGREKPILREQQKEALCWSYLASFLAIKFYDGLKCFKQKLLIQ